MNVVSQDIFDVPVAAAVVLTNRESCAFPRLFILRNLTSGNISFQIQASPDGLTWTAQTLSDGTTEITLGPIGAGDDVAVERLTSANLLRVRASGGGDDRDLSITLVRTYVDTTQVWTSPLT